MWTEPPPRSNVRADDRCVAAVAPLPESVAENARERRRRRRWSLRGLGLRRRAGTSSRSGRGTAAGWLLRQCRRVCQERGPRCGGRGPGGRRRFGHAVRVLEVAADRHLRADHRQKVRRDCRGPNLLGLPCVTRDRLPERGDRGHLLEDLLLLDQLGIIARRDREIDDVPRAQVLPDEHEPIGVRVRQRPQQHGVHHAENGGAGANAERERDDGRDAERRHLPQRPRRVAEVVKQCPHIHFAQAQNVPWLIRRRWRISPKRRQFRRSHARPEQAPPARGTPRAEIEHLRLAPDRRPRPEPNRVRGV